MGQGFPFKTLTMQSRMRPEISRLLLDIYPSLTDNLAVVANHQMPAGLVDSPVFWNTGTGLCVREEKDAAGRFFNWEEAKRAVYLALHLVQTGTQVQEGGPVHYLVWEGQGCPAGYAVGKDRDTGTGGRAGTSVGRRRVGLSTWLITWWRLGHRYSRAGRYEVSSKTNATDLLKTKRFKLESYFLQHKVSLIFR